MIISTCTFILKAENLAESDQRLLLYTEELGKLRANIIGVKKSFSKLRVFTLPLIEYRLNVFVRGMARSGFSAPGKIINGEILTDLRPTVNNRAAWAEALCILEILDRLTPATLPNAKEFAWVRSALSAVRESPQPQLVRVWFALGLLKILGYSLRSNQLWHMFSQQERALLERLARWDLRSDVFSQDESSTLERLAMGYLGRYLSAPLKTDVFMRKLKQFEDRQQQVRLPAAVENGAS